MSSSALGLDSLEHKLNYHFNDQALLAQAVTHRSLKHTGSYERLEFLGDRVLALVIADQLFADTNQLNEGSMTQSLVTLVRRETLAAIAEKLDLYNYIRHRLATTASGRERLNMLADSCEAIIAAVYLDGGWPAAQTLITRLWSDYVRLQTTAAVTTTAGVSRSKLQEWLQARRLPLPEFTVLNRCGSDHQPEFNVKVSVAGYGEALASGPNKKIAFQNASQLLMLQLQDK